MSERDHIAACYRRLYNLIHHGGYHTFKNREHAAIKLAVARIAAADGPVVAEQIRADAEKEGYRS